MNVAAIAERFNKTAVRENWHQRCDPSLSFRDPGYDALLSIWRDKAGTRKMPRRAQLSPRDLKDYLKNIIVGQREQTNPSRYRFRLIGTGLTEIVGEHTGQLFEDSVPPQHLPRWVECCDMILDSGQPWRFVGRVHVSGREYLHGEHLYLPLEDESGVPSYVMGYCRYTPRFAANEGDMQADWENEIASIPGGLR